MHRYSSDLELHRQLMEIISIFSLGTKLRRETLRPLIMFSKKSTSTLENSGSVDSTIGGLSQSARMESLCHLRLLENQLLCSLTHMMIDMMTTMSKPLRKKLVASPKEDSSFMPKE